ncbi:hypothetical protein [Bhargavaea massiliensis]|uniref:hypothetical protein n=1 Tax=Bhargavaea massiliensis TaxID=2697500 RepID=UPI001BCDC31F|nr:hypothetical protein [Bhargavaea massiliensis]
MTNFQRILYKEITPGDRRKFKGESNDTPSGGGAMDLRFSPYDLFKDFLVRMFPEKKSDRIRTNTFRWYEEDFKGPKSEPALLHEPTKARPGEWRIANINKYLPFGKLPPEDEGEAFVILIQDENGEIWPKFASKKSLIEKWHEDIAEPILLCHKSKKRENMATAGFIEAATGERKCKHEG